MNLGGGPSAQRDYFYTGLVGRVHMKHVRSKAVASYTLDFLAKLFNSSNSFKISNYI